MRPEVIRPWIWKAGASALLGVLWGALSAQDGSSLQIEGLRLTNTQGTLRLQDIRAREANMASGGSVSNLKGVEAVMQSAPKPDEEPQRANIKSPRARLYLGGAVFKEEERTAAEVTPDLIRELHELPDKDRAKGDFVLEGETLNAQEGGVVLDIVDRAVILTDLLLWSEAALRLVCPVNFVQNATTPEGEPVTISGAGFAVDRDFLDWTYLATGSAPVVLTFGEKP